MARCVILSAVPVGNRAERLLLPDDFVIACDAGYKNAKRLHRTPDLVLGDFDSMDCPDAEKPIVLPKEKDDTDTHYAARLAAQKGYRSVLMLGALGGTRLEHTLANLATGLWLTEQGIETMLADEYSEIQYVTPEKPVVLPDDPESYFSVFPMGECAEGVCEHGAKYEIENAVLTQSFPVGISNETSGKTVRISVKRGTLLLICTRKDHQLEQK